MAPNDLDIIRGALAEYQAAVRVLAASHTTVADRKAAIAIRDAFLQLAPIYVAALIKVAA